MITHILNGDALLERFPKAIAGDIIVMRECLVDGDIRGETLSQLLINRADFIESYPQVPKGEYSKLSLPEIDKITRLPVDEHVVCWFEEDLFCQVNFWFVIWLLAKQQCQSIYYVRPKKGCEYSYANMTNNELTNAFEQKIQLTLKDQQTLAQFWPLYQQHKEEDILTLCLQLSDDLAFIMLAVNAQLARRADESGLGYPERELKKIMIALGTDDFGAVFTQFSQQMALYSFGDLQVFRMFNMLKDKMK